MTRSSSVYITVHWVLTCLTGHVLHDEERLVAQLGVRGAVRVALRVTQRRLEHGRRVGRTVRLVHRLLLRQTCRENAQQPCHSLHIL